ncbi:hypothetical protein Droror1_Dr00017570 [Drosera rotundifolia]
MVLTGGCSGSDELEESIIHCLTTYTSACDVWSSSPFDLPILSPSPPFVEWFSLIMQQRDTTELAQIWEILAGIWHNRNQRVHRGSIQPTSMVVGAALSSTQELFTTKARGRDKEVTTQEQQATFSTLALLKPRVGKLSIHSV